MSSCYRPYEGRPGGGLRLYGDDVERLADVIGVLPEDLDHDLILAALDEANAMIDRRYSSMPQHVRSTIESGREAQGRLDEIERADDAFYRRHVAPLLGIEPEDRPREPESSGTREEKLFAEWSARSL